MTWQNVGDCYFRCFVLPSASFCVFCVAHMNFRLVVPNKVWLFTKVFIACDRDGNIVSKNQIKP